MYIKIHVNCLKCGVFYYYVLCLNQYFFRLNSMGIFLIRKYFITSELIAKVVKQINRKPFYLWVLYC